jgi:hypothetical protein
MDGLTPVVLRRVAAALAGVRVSVDTSVTVVVTKDAEPQVAVCQSPKEVRQAVKGFGGTGKVNIIKNCLVPAGSAAHEWQVQEVDVTYARVKDGRLETARIPVDTTRCDALFWSPAAVEKFLVPHYSAVYGASHAASMQAAYDTQTTEGVVHERLSQYVAATLDATSAGATSSAPAAAPLPPAPQA